MDKKIGLYLIMGLIECLDFTHIRSTEDFSVEESKELERINASMNCKL